MCVWFPNWPIQRRRHWEFRSPERKRRDDFSPIRSLALTAENSSRSQAPLGNVAEANLRFAPECYSRRDAAKQSFGAGNSEFSIFNDSASEPSVDEPSEDCKLQIRNALILHASPRGKLRVVACSRAARRRGVRPGMLLAEAQSLFAPAAACFEPHDPQADRAALRQLALWCERFSPRVAVDLAESPDCLLLDVAGCGYNFGGEEELAAKAVAELRQQGCWAVAAIADTLGAAWAVAHAVTPGRDGPRVLVVPPGRHLEALHPLPVELLRLSVEVVELLREFDLCEIGQLLELPRAELPSRFGPELLIRLDQALGTVPELLLPERPAPVIEAAWPFEPPVADRQTLDAVIGRLLDELLDRLRPRQLGIQRLLCSLELVIGGPLHFAVELLRPSLSLRHLSELARLHLERLEIPAEVAGVTLEATRVAPLEFHQGHMFDDGPCRWREVTGLLERLSNRLGEKAVLRPHLQPDAQPEFACQYEPWLHAAVVSSSEFRVSSLNRPPCLKTQPEAIAVVSRESPVGFRWQGRAYAVAHCWGPERIETGWWRGADIRRDYFIVETTAGERFWLFRALPGERWFLHGVFG